ncbi:hypothetical protein FHP05_11435 [Cerasibacillus terrae]|uniref:Uncharacterized protein n=1 Tax=Cerasibacillus terrae TaxID=2498845 RepID=A0A5C8NSF7_9BACI|nr:hypothetical protein [Cerasibacillus terrae]TXL63413.1 hypothetical protein FHP05_11435 [Cerasibacillus terrae]
METKEIIIYLGSFMIIFMLLYKIVGIINDTFLQYNGVFLYILLMLVVPGIVLISLASARKITDFFISKKN